MARQLLRRARKRAGLTQQQLADRAAVSQPAIAAYETGRRQPTLPTLYRLLRAAGFEPHIRLAPSPAEQAPPTVEGWTPLSAARAAAGIRSAIRREDASEALRWVARLVSDVDRAQTDRRAALLQRVPASTGDRRWDAMLAGAAEHVCHRHGLPIPSWTAHADRFLDEAWFVIETILGASSPRLAVSAFIDSPAALANRGVFVHASSLESM